MRTSCALLFLIPALTFGEDRIPVGVARIDITPDYRVRLSGYGNRREESDGVEQRIWAKAMAIGDDQNGVVLLTVDNLGVPEEVNGVVARRLKERFGWDRSRLAVCSSHTHSAPMLTNVAPTLFGMPIPPEHQRNIDRYTRELTQKLVTVVEEAIKARQPSLIEFARGKVGFAANRRTANGPVDHDLPVVRVTDAQGGIRAVLANYACHCTTLGGDFNRIHGDWAGHAQELIERSIPGCVAMVSIGCGADANPSPRTGLKFSLQHGEALAAEVQRLMKGKWKRLKPPTKTSYASITLQFDKIPSRAEWEQRAKQPGAIGYHAQVQIKRLDAGDTLPTTLPYPVQSWVFGDDLVMVFLGGEVVVDYSLRLKRQFDASRIWVTAYANDVPCYIPSVRILNEGGYEAEGAMIYYNRPTRFAPDVEQRIIEEVRRQLPECFRGVRDPNEFPPPREPEESRRAIQVKPGLQVELAAAEPLVQSPVAIDWGPDGKLWVVEMYDYPTGVDGNYKPGGRVKYLLDTNADGRYDQAVTLAEDLPFPTGVMAWRKGVLVCAAPDVLYLEDTDGDGRADIRRVILTGFDVSNFQARVNGLSDGLDGWVYAASGLMGGRITAKIGPAISIDLGGRDLRFHPEHGLPEAVSGLSQQGRVRNDEGDWFGNDNSNLLWHYPLDESYLRRNPNFHVPPARVDVTTGDADPNRLFPVSRLQRRFNDLHHAGRVTSACAPTIYRDDWLGAEYGGNAFICEPVHNVVTRRVLEPRGLTYRGRRADDEQSREFLASTDSWFRPVQVRTGPDGALWVVDMYRFVIEHPRWIPPDRLAELDVRAGADRGRIYRVVPVGKSARKVPPLAALSPPELVQTLDSPNGVVRDLAQRRLIELAPAATDELRQLIRKGGPRGRLHALCVLGTTKRLDESTLRAALNDSSAAVRRWAIRWAEPLVATHAEWREEVSRREKDDDLRVRCQLAYSLGVAKSDTSAAVLARLAAQDGRDPYFRSAILSSLSPETLSPFLANLVKNGAQPSSREVLSSAWSLVPVMLPTSQWETLIREISAAQIGVVDRLRLLAAMVESIDRRREPWPDSLKSMIDAWSQDARRLLEDEKSSLEEKALAIRFLGRSPRHADADVRRLVSFVRPVSPPELQRAALDRLGTVDSLHVAASIVEIWRELTPTQRPVVMDLLLSRRSWIEPLVSALESGVIRPSDLNTQQRSTLLRNAPSETRTRVEKLLEGGIDANRQRLVDSYLVSLSKLKGDARRGSDVFARSCAPCHRLGATGHALGPDLAAVTARDLTSWLVAILDPNRALDGRYALLQANTRDGRQLSGMLQAETAGSIVLLAAGGTKHELLRSDLEDLINTGRSLMPEGLETEIPPAAMADLIAFLQASGRPSKQVPGNRPQTVKAQSDGSFRLPAEACAIFGDQITFESEFKNLGFWSGEQDHAVWNVELAQPGRYLVELEFACDAASSGNQLRIEAGGHQLNFRVPSTGGWDRYVTQEVGVITLMPGAAIVVRPVPPLKGALVDLREVRLKPQPSR